MKHYEYIDLGINSTKKPFSTHLWWWHQTYGIYMVDSTNQKILLKSTIARLQIDGSDWDTIDLATPFSTDQKIQAGYLDGNDLWLLMCNIGGFSRNFEVGYVELDNSDNVVVNGIGSVSPYDMYAYDLFKIGTTMYAQVAEYRQSPAFDTFLKIYDVTSTPTLLDTLLPEQNNLGPHCMYGSVVGTDYYWVNDRSSFWQCKMYKFDSITDTITALAGESQTNTGWTSREKEAMMYDGGDKLYFLLKDSANTDYYLYYYTIAGNDIIKLGKSDMIIMLDRNAGSLREKAFLGKKVWQLYVDSPNLHLIADLSNLDGNIKYITNYLLMDTTNDIYQWVLQDSAETITGCQIEYKGSEVTIGEIVTDNSYVINQVLSFYDDDGTLFFKGKIKKKLIRSGIKTYELLGLDKEIINNRFTKSYSVQNIKYIMEALLDIYAYNIRYESGTISSNFTATHSVEFDNKTFQEAFDTLMDLDDGIWWVTPDGVVYAYKLADIPSTGDTIYRTATTNSDHILTPPKYSENLASYNKVHIYGGFSGTARLEATANDIEDQQENGVLEFVGHYPHIRNQTELNLLATAILNRTGMLNPIYISVFLNLTFRQIGKKLNFEFDGYEELENATDYYILSAVYYPLSEEMKLVLSSGLIQEGREYQVELLQTSHADEEQIDIVGGVVGSSGHAEIHILATSGPHTGTLPWGDLSKTGSSLAELATRNHADLQNKNAETDIKHLTDDQITALHAKYTNGEAVQAVEDAGILLSVNKAIHINGDPADITYTGIVITVDTTGCAVGDAVYFDGSNSVAQAKADNIATMPAIGVMVVGGKVLTLGVIRNDAFYILLNSDCPIYISESSAGDMTHTAPSTIGNIVQVIGHSINSREVFVCPSLSWDVVSAGGGLTWVDCETTYTSGVELTIDGTYHNLDISGDMPDGAIDAIGVFGLLALDDATNTWARIKQKDRVYAYGVHGRITVININNYWQGIVPIDGGTIDYGGSVGLTSMYIYLKGYFKGDGISV